MTRTLLSLLALLLAVVFLPPIVADLAGYGPDTARVRHDGREVELPEGRFLHVVELGSSSGPPVVLVHGLPGTTTDWAETPERLAALGHRVLVYDRVGYGFSSRETAPGERHSYKSSAQDLLDLLDALGIPEAILAGWSYGGGVVQQLAGEHPERVRALVLIGSVGPASADGQREEEGGIVAWLVASPAGSAAFRWIGSVPWIADAVTGGAVADAFSGEEAVPEGFVAMTRASLALPGTFPAFVAEVRNNDVTTLAPERIRRPTLVLHGTEDRLVPYTVAKDLDARLPQRRLETVFGGSHMLPVTHPQLVAKLIHELAEGGMVVEAQPPGG